MQEAPPPPVRDTGHKRDFQLYPSIYLPPHHHLTIPDSGTTNAPHISSHEIMSVCRSDARHSWGQSKHGCPQFCPLMKVGPGSAGRGRGAPACSPQCLPTQLWPSQGSYGILPSWLRFQVRLGAPAGNLCQVYSVSAVSQPGVRLCFTALVWRTAQTRTLFCRVGTKIMILWCDTSLKFRCHHARQYTEHSVQAANTL